MHAHRQYSFVQICTGNGTFYILKKFKHAYQHHHYSLLVELEMHLYEGYN